MKAGGSSPPAHTMGMSPSGSWSLTVYQDFVGSNPIMLVTYTRLVQLVEQMLHTHKVTGSNPVSGTIYCPNNTIGGVLLS